MRTPVATETGEDGIRIILRQLTDGVEAVGELAYKNRQEEEVMRDVLVLVNPRSGLRLSFDGLREAFDRHWESHGVVLSYQFCQSPEDSLAKVARAVERQLDAVIVVGGDGTVNSIAKSLVDTDVALGVIPAGSGNGFARHFEIPLTPDRAVEALSTASVKPVDVGMVDGRPFFVTCSMAWEAAIAKTFARYPFRGIIPYVFAGVQEFFEYSRQDISVVLDGRETIRFERPLVFTVANLSQYGGGAKIAPQAKADDGRLELVVVERQSIARFVNNLVSLFQGSINELPEVVSRRFEHLRIRRDEPTSIQVDGELVEAGSEIDVTVKAAALRVLVPARSAGKPDG